MHFYLTIRDFNRRYIPVFKRPIFALVPHLASHLKVNFTALYDAEFAVGDKPCANSMNCHQCCFLLH